MLAFSGATTEALNAVSEAERLWPGATNLFETRFAILANYGDPREALRLMPPEFNAYPGSEATRTSIVARIDPTARNIDQAVVESRRFADVNGVRAGPFQTLATFGLTDELFELLMRSQPAEARRVRDHIFRPNFDRFWREPRAMRVAQRIGLTDYWRQSGKWPDFCTKVAYDCRAEAARL
jgi:hypothetical protein